MRFDVVMSLWFSIESVLDAEAAGVPITEHQDTGTRYKFAGWFVEGFCHMLIELACCENISTKNTKHVNINERLLSKLTLHIFQELYVKLPHQVR